VAIVEAVRRKKARRQARQAKYQRQKKTAKSDNLSLSEPLTPPPPTESEDGSGTSDDEPLI
jgi:hypothetical protein